MTMDRLSLGRFLELLQLPHSRRLRAIERDARKAVYEEQFGKTSDARDFYGPFWSDAKRSIVDQDFCLADATQERMASAKGRRRLYPTLLIGFEHGWRLITLSRIATSTLSLVARLSMTIKGAAEDDYIHASNLLAVKEPSGRLHITYPYFSKDVALGARHAKLGLKSLDAGFRTAKPHTVAMLDVLRGNIFIADKGDAESSAHEELTDRYAGVMREWRSQKRLVSR